jgi:2-polyprenyl-3-methyl-5-hydroxy-6-metoxy-1,4-benzoquinol methylase
VSARVATDLAAATSPAPFSFCCPACRAPVEAQADAYRCGGCGRNYPLRDGVSSFTDLGYFYGTLPKESVGEVIALAAGNRMGELRRHLTERKVKGRKVFLRSFQDSFADGRFVLPLDKSHTVLDLGCGYGGLSIPLARSCGRVVSADATFERVKMVALRAEHEGLDNLVPVHANALELPLPPGSFDCVLLNGVLEWVGEWDPSRAPRDVQVGVLTTCRKLLKPGGMLYLAIENRWGLELLYRRKDHNKLYWTSFLPRALADAATRLLKRKPYRTYTYGRRGLERLLRDAGFDTVDLYCPWARYQNPDAVVRVDDEVAFARLQATHLRGESRLEAAAFGALRMLGLHWTVAPAWIAVARTR